jgi:hypothetical protein
MRKILPTILILLGGVITLWSVSLNLKAIDAHNCEHGCVTPTPKPTFSPTPRPTESPYPNVTPCSLGGISFTWKNGEVSNIHQEEGNNPCSTPTASPTVTPTLEPTPIDLPASPTVSPETHSNLAPGEAPSDAPCVKPLGIPVVTYLGQNGNTFSYSWTYQDSSITEFWVKYGTSPDNLIYSKLEFQDKTDITMHPGESNFVSVAPYNGCLGIFSAPIN